MTSEIAPFTSGALVSPITKKLGKPTVDASPSEPQLKSFQKKWMLLHGPGALAMVLPLGKGELRGPSSMPTPDSMDSWDWTDATLLRDQA